MGWVAKMMRRLAVPIALRNVGAHDRNKMTKIRTLRAPEDDPLEYHILTKLAETRVRMDRLRRCVDDALPSADCSDILNELEYLKSDIELSLIEIDADIEDAPSSEDILAEEAETVLA
jgi:succinate dehydrogenase/fumarate reductase-like Fe-S protein